MILSVADRRYRWIDEWVRMPAPEEGSGRTHAVEVADDGRVIIFHQGDPAVRVYEPDGALRDAWGSDWLGAHGLTLVEENETPYLWLTDVDSGRVEKTTLQGETVQTIEGPPDHPAYEDGDYSPSWVAVDDPEAGGTGDIWVADGYGEFLVHRYTPEGDPIDTLDGTESGPAYQWPHGLTFDATGDDRKIWLADAENQRIRTYNPDTAEQIDSFGTEVLTSPRGAIRDGTDIVVIDLFSNKLSVFESDGSHIGDLGANPTVSDRDDHPDVDRGVLETGKFNSPHDAAVAPDGSLYVVEWIENGRVIKLEAV